MIIFFNSDANFFEEDALYVIQDNKCYSAYVMKNDEFSEDLVFHNLYTNMHKDILLNLGDMSITERIHDNKAEVYYENHYL